MKKAILFVLMTVGLMSCAAAPSETASRGGFQLIGATVVAPEGSDWVTLKSISRIVAFGKAGDLLGETNILSVAIVRIDASLSDSAFLAQAKRAKAPENRPSRFQDAMISTREVAFKGAQCIRFEGSSLNTTARIETASDVYESRTGYTCRHPLRKDAVVEFTLTSRSGSRGHSAAELGLAERFFENIAFNENLFDRLRERGE